MFCEIALFENSILEQGVKKNKESNAMKKSGFTLLELIIVIIVIGILASMAMPQFMRVTERGRIAKALAVLNMYRKAEGMYFAYNSEYTAVDANLATQVPEILSTAGDSDWSYVITSGSSDVFSVEATRSSGGYINCTITVDQDGVIGGDHPGATGTW